MLWRKVTIVLRPFTRHNSAVYSSCECPLSKATGNSDSQNAMLETTENTSTWEVEEKVVLYLLDKVWSQRLSYIYF